MTHVGTLSSSDTSMIKLIEVHRNVKKNRKLTIDLEKSNDQTMRMVLIS